MTRILLLLLTLMLGLVLLKTVYKQPSIANAPTPIAPPPAVAPPPPLPPPPPPPDVNVDPPPPTNDVWVTTSWNGRLGNNMWQAASSYGIARARNAKWCLPEGRISEAVHFKVPAPLCPTDVTFADETEGRHNVRFVPSLMDGSGKGHTRVLSYLQSLKYFEPYGIPFVLKDDEWAQKWIAGHGVNVAIHVRAPEYGARAPASYFVRAIQLLRDLTRGEPLAFVVTTDDRAWVEQQPVFNGMLVASGHTPGQDMAINANCRHLIMSLGTFGLWAGYLRKNTDGFVIYWIVSFHLSDPNFDPEGTWPAAWKPIAENADTPPQADNCMELTYTRHMLRVLEGCGEICDTTLQGTPSLFFNFIPKRFDCAALCLNAAIDAPALEPSPPATIPDVMLPMFTFGGQIPVGATHMDSQYLGANAAQPVWSREMIDGMITKARNRELEGNYGVYETNWLIEGLSQLNLSGADALVIGSENPWVEACVLQAGAAHVTTIEYGKIVSEHPQVSAMTPDEVRARFSELAGRFDAVVSFSSLEHSGLGRYGDALNPWGDKQAVARAWCLAKPGAGFVVAVMSGGDFLEFNAHRVYGPLQYPHLFANLEQVWRAGGGSQVVHVLRKPLA